MKPKNSGMQIPLGDVLFEFRRVGNALRVTAIDAQTGTEVFMVADPRQSTYAIKSLAARKLTYVMNKNKRRIQDPKDLN